MQNETKKNDESFRPNQNQNEHRLQLEMHIITRMKYIFTKIYLHMQVLLTASYNIPFHN